MAFDQALAALDLTPDEWSTQPREIVRFRHTLYPLVPEVATMLDSNRATYAYIVVLRNPTPTSESILSLGQSGSIRLDATTNLPVFDDNPHRTFSTSQCACFEIRSSRSRRIRAGLIPAHSSGSNSTVSESEAKLTSPRRMGSLLRDSQP
jgi:hypothetical protein